LILRDEGVILKTYYLVEENGYRAGVKGRAVTLHLDFYMFWYKKNNRYFICCRKSGYVFGQGDTLGEAKRDTLYRIKRSGVEPTKWMIRKLIKRQGPGKGGKKSCEKE